MAESLKRHNVRKQNQTKKDQLIFDLRPELFQLSAALWKQLLSAVGVHAVGYKNHLIICTYDLITTTENPPIQSGREAAAAAAAAAAAPLCNFLPS